jgi:hypothetical protein
MDTSVLGGRALALPACQYVPQAFEPAYSEHYWQAGCRHPHRSSIWSPARLQYSLQYLPYAPSVSTLQLQAGCAHLDVGIVIPLSSSQGLAYFWPTTTE